MIFLKIANFISTKVLIRTKVAWYLMLCSPSIYFFHVCLILLIFTVDNYIFLKNQSIAGHIAILNSFVEHGLLISFCKMLIILLYYTAMLKEIILLVT